MHCALWLVTNTSERTVELRAVVGAANSSDLWQLRCAVREHLVAFLQESYPDRLPRVRVELEQPTVSGERLSSRSASRPE